MTPLAMVITHEDHEVQSWMFVGGQGPWSFQSIREFLRKIVLSGLKGLCPCQFGGSTFFFWGGGKNTVPQQHNIPIKP